MRDHRYVPPAGYEDLYPSTEGAGPDRAYVLLVDDDAGLAFATVR